MPNTSIVPNRQIVLPPLESYLRVVILSYKVDQIGEEEVRFISCHAVNSFSKSFVDEDLLPSRDSCEF
jgi:hypothetical protein